MKAMKNTIDIVMEWPRKYIVETIFFIVLYLQIAIFYTSRNNSLKAPSTKVYNMVKLLCYMYRLVVYGD
jgi:hypothetical protein